MKSLDRIGLQTKIRLYNVYTLPILLYGADTWSMTVEERWPNTNICMSFPQDVACQTG